MWQRRTRDALQPVCTLCYLTTHLDSPTAAHARLAWLPGLTQVSALLAVLAGEKALRRDGRRLWRWMVCHARDVEHAWGTARAREFAAALARLPPSCRPRLQHHLDGCVPLFPPAVFDDLTLDQLELDACADECEALYEQAEQLYRHLSETLAE